MAHGCNFDKYKDCAIVAIPNFGRKSDVIEGLDELDELGLSFIFSWPTGQLCKSGKDGDSLPAVANR